MFQARDEYDASTCAAVLMTALVFSLLWFRRHDATQVDKRLLGTAEHQLGRLEGELQGAHRGRQAAEAELRWVDWRLEQAEWCLEKAEATQSATASELQVPHRGKAQAEDEVRALKQQLEHEKAAQRVTATMLQSLEFRAKLSDALQQGRQRATASELQVARRDKAQAEDEVRALKQQLEHEKAAQRVTATMLQSLEFRAKLSDALQRGRQRATASELQVARRDKAQAEDEVRALKQQLEHVKAAQRVTATMLQSLEFRAKLSDALQRGRQCATASELQVAHRVKAQAEDVSDLNDSFAVSNQRSSDEDGSQWVDELDEIEEELLSATSNPARPDSRSVMDRIRVFKNNVSNGDSSDNSRDCTNGFKRMDDLSARSKNFMRSIGGGSITGMSVEEEISMLRIENRSLNYDLELMREQYIAIIREINKSRKR